MQNSTGSAKVSRRSSTQGKRQSCPNCLKFIDEAPHLVAPVQVVADSLLYALEKARQDREETVCLTQKQVEAMIDTLSLSTRAVEGFTREN